MTRTPDLFEGIFDNRATSRREVWREGHLCRYARKECVGSPVSVWAEVHAPWGAYADLPSNRYLEEVA